MLHTHYCKKKTKNLIKQIYYNLLSNKINCLRFFLVSLGWWSSSQTEIDKEIRRYDQSIPFLFLSIDLSYS
jgi:hypothetical protein